MKKGGRQREMMTNRGKQTKTDNSICVYIEQTMIDSKGREGLRIKSTQSSRSFGSFLRSCHGITERDTE